MEDWRIALVIGASVSAFVGVLVNRAIGRSDEQVRAASRLRAHILHWRKTALKSKLQSVINAGAKWNERFKELARNNRGQSLALLLVALEKEFQDDLKEKLQEHMTDGSEVDLEDWEETLKHQKTMPEVSYERTINMILRLRDEIADGTGFIPDSDVAVLDQVTVADVVELRLLAVSLIESIVLMAEGVRTAENAEKMSEDVIKQVVDAMVEGVRVGFLLDRLAESADRYLTRSRWAGVLANFFR